MCKGLTFIEKVKILSLIRKEEKSYAEVAKICAMIASPICQIVKEKFVFCFCTSDCKVMVTVHDKCLVNMGKALYL